MNDIQVAFYIPLSALIVLIFGFVFRFSLLRVIGYVLLLLSAFCLYRYILPHEDFSDLRRVLQFLTGGILLTALVGIWGERMNESLAEVVKWPGVMLAMAVVFILWSRHPQIRGAESNFYHEGGTNTHPAPP